MTQPETEIRRAWRHIAGPDHDGYVDALLIRYAEPHRHYHTATHIMFVLRHVHDVAQASAAGSSAAVPSPELIAAALYHDAIYDPTAARQRGAQRRVGHQRPCRDRMVHTALCRSCRDGRRHRWPSRRSMRSRLRDAGDGATETAMLLDADLAILGAEPGAYQAYVNGVRAEYAHVARRRMALRVGRLCCSTSSTAPRCSSPTTCTPRSSTAPRANIEAELAALSHRHPRND